MTQRAGVSRYTRSVSAPTVTPETVKSHVKNIPDYA
jgi:hypothetical protein